MTLFSPHNNYTTTRDCTGLLFNKENVILRKGIWFSFLTLANLVHFNINCIGSVIMKETLKYLIEFNALTKSVVVLLCSVATILPVFSQSGIDTIRNECTGYYSLSARNILDGLNTNSLRISNLYQANFSNWNTWNKDYALSFWVEIGEGLDAQLLLNN
jgi:hypothetical protein